MNIFKGKTIFNDKAIVYQEARPSYPTIVAIEMLKNLSEKPVITDVGAGTGKFTELLLNQNATVYAVEPNEAMRNQLKITYGDNPNLHIINADAEKTTLQNKFTDLIVVAHAFHWFNKNECKKEFKRILKDNGKVGLIWNWYANNPTMNEYRHLIYECATKEVLFIKEQVNTEFLNNFFDKYETKEYTNDVAYNFNTIIKLAQSSHCTPVKGEKGYNEMYVKIKKWFDKYNCNGNIKFSFNCTTYMGN